MTETPRTITYLPLDHLLERVATRNPKRHDAAGIRASIDRFGFVDPILHDGRTDRLIAGHGRLEDLVRRRDDGEPEPDGIVVDVDGTWHAPVTTGWRSIDDQEAEAVAVALNQLPGVGGWNPAELAALLDDLSGTPSGLAGTGFSGDDLDDLLARMQEMPTLRFDEDERTSAGGTAHVDHTPPTHLEGYRDKASRAFVLDYPLDEFDELVGLFAGLREALGVETNSEVVLHLARSWDASEVRSS